MRNLRPIAEAVKATTSFRDVKLGLVRDDAPAEVRAEAVRGIREIIELQHELTGRPVVMVPILVSIGSVSREKLPPTRRACRSTTRPTRSCRILPWRAGWRRGCATRSGGSAPAVASSGGAGERIPPSRRP